MKKLKFTKVKIVKCIDDVSYNENIPFNNYRAKAEYDQISDIIRKLNAFANCVDSMKTCRIYNRMCKRYEALRKQPGKNMHIENPKWMIVDSNTSERIKVCDSIEQAKRYCIKNDLDFGMF